MTPTSWSIAGHPNHRSLARRTAADTEGDVRRVLGKLEATGQGLTLLRILANEPHAFRPFVLFSSALLRETTFPADVREVVILWLARRGRQSYEWLEHVPMARRAGVTDQQIELLETESAMGDEFSDDQHAAIAFTTELLDRRSLSPARWGEAVERWGTDGTIALLLTIGWWAGLVPLFLDALGLQEPDGGA